LALSGNVQSAEVSVSFSENMKRIVVATDLEGNSEAALEYARKLAGAYGARIVLAHGLDPLDFAAVDTMPRRVLRNLPDQARAAVDQMVADLVREGIHSHSEVRQGAVVQMLLDVARQYKAGLIVVGTRGHCGAGPVAVGAIVEALVRLAPCPVLAVSADWNAGEFRPVPGGPVLLAMDRNDATEAAVDAAGSLAHAFKRTLIVVHARPAAKASAFLNPCATTMEQFGVRPSAAMRIRCVVKDGHPADAIPQAVTQYSPSILVAGVKRRSESIGRHGTIFSLLASSRVPVLCVPSAANESNPLETGIVAELVATNNRG
jgi:nucleotide-binding universal stress UspA family protein